MDLPKLLGQRLRAIRKRTGMTQVEFCEAAKISQSYLSSLERGKGWVAFARVTEALEEIGADPLDLFTDSGGDPMRRELLELLEDADPGLVAMFHALLLRDRHHLARSKRSSGELGELDASDVG